MVVGINHFARLLSYHLNILFPNLKCGIYVSRRRGYIHLEVDYNFFTFEKCDEVIETIKNFTVSGYDINQTHKFLFPARVLSTRWKHDYIIFKRKI